MKILCTHRFFWPDTSPYGVMLREIAINLADSRHEVHVFASQPSYRPETKPAPRQEIIGSVKVRRCFAFSGEKENFAKRLANVALYCIALMWRILVLRPDVVTAATFPPVAAAWCASLIAKLVGAKFVYHVQDIHPEVSVYSGGKMGRGIFRKLFTLLDNQSLRRASAVIVLSKDMADTLRTRDLGDLPIHIINNFQLNSYETAPFDLAEAYIKPAGKMRVIFAGNLGRFQNLPLLAEGVAGCFADHPNLELMFLGSGDAEAALKARWASNPQVQFAPFLPLSKAQSIIAQADVGLVSLTTDIYRVAYPSKIPTYLGLGVPLLAAIEPDSNIAKDLANAGLGVVPKGNESTDITNALNSILGDLERYKSAAVKYGERDSQAEANAHWSRLIENILD